MRFIIIAIITVRAPQLNAFREFEMHAVRMMSRYGGRIERNLVAHPASQDASQDTVTELHLVSFPDHSTYLAYTRDPELLRLRPVRDAAVIHAEVWFGSEGPDYCALADLQSSDEESKA